MARRKPQAPRSAVPTQTSQFPHISAADKANLRAVMKEHLGWDHEPREMQITAAIAQVDGDDVIVHAATGMGKTAIVAAPHAFPQNRGRVSIFVSPLIALQEEMVGTFRDEFGLAAVAVNSSRRKSLNATLLDICAGKYAVVLISPEMLQTRRFINTVLRNKDFSRRVLSLIVDEAHTVSHWGAHFRKKYGSLGVVRAFLPPRTSVVALSATLTPRVRADVLRKLHFGSKFISIDLGNNRPNVSIVVRACHRLLSSYADLDFVIPSDVRTLTDIPPTFVYADNKDEGASIIDHLRERLPVDMQQDGLVRPFNASLSHEYRKNALQHFRAGNIRVLVCTDAAGMGCNLSNIEVVVQWKLPQKLSMFVQRAGRAARRPGAEGLAVLLVEPSAYTDVSAALSGTAPAADSAAAGTTAPDTGTASGDGNKSRAKKSRKVRAPKGWAKAHGRSRGAASQSASNDIDHTIRLAVNTLAEDEGLITLVQTGDCRRRVIAEAFESADKSSTVPCCDLCCPELLDRTLPGPGVKRKARKPKDKDKQPAKDVVDALRDWRLQLWEEDFSYQHFGETALLSDDVIRDIAMSPDMSSIKDLAELLAGEWLLWKQYGKSLWHALAPVYDARERGGKPSTSTASSSLDAPPPAPPALGAVVPAKRRHDAPESAPATGDALNTSSGSHPAGPSSSADPSPALLPPSGTPPSKRRRTESEPSTSTTAASGRAAPPAAPAIPASPSSDPLAGWPAGWPQPQYVKLRKNQTMPAPVRKLRPQPVPQGQKHDPSRVMRGTDGKVYFCHPDGKWWIMPPPPTFRTSHSTGPGAAASDMQAHAPPQVSASQPAVAPLAVPAPLEL